MDQSDLADAAGVSVETIKRLEAQDGPLTTGRAATVTSVEKALEDGGIIFIAADDENGPGVRLRSSE